MAKIKLLPRLSPSKPSPSTVLPIPVPALVLTDYSTWIFFSSLDFIVLGLET
jgi:hypothetical protein